MTGVLPTGAVLVGRTRHMRRRIVDAARVGRVTFGVARLGLARQGVFGHGKAWLGSAWFSAVGQGSPGLVDGRF